MIDVTRHGRHVATLNPSEGFYASQEGGGTVASLIAGQPVSHVSMDAGITRDIWSAIEPDIETPALQRIVQVGNRHAAAGRRDRSASHTSPATYLQHPPPAQFHFIVSPLVMWIWIGGLIVFAGGLTALWPAPGAVRRRVAVRAQSAGRASLVAAREAKYRDIRDLELDYRMGKLSREDYRQTDAALRVEALAILDRLEGPAPRGARVRRRSQRHQRPRRQCQRHGATAIAGQRRRAGRGWS